MKGKNKNELDVDFIGGQDPLTKEEEKAISNYINAKKGQAKKTHAAHPKQITKRGSSFA